jgi:hypothetical protein
LNIINADSKPYKNIKNNQSMIKKLCAPYPEIKIEADACFETKKMDIVFMFGRIKNKR